ncbi:MAG: peptidylprolyl isomerase [Ilumatobacteraceae bacterium]|nr:peptidylprolyl isomerase [Ilumatobacteraceae bacterium]
MGTDKRDRQKANKAAKLEAERAAAAKAKRNATIRTVVIAGVLLVAAMLIFGALAGCSSSAGEGGEGGAKATTTAADGAADDSSASDGEASYGTGECAPADGVDEPVLTFDDAPKRCIDPAKTYTATIETTEGTVVVELDTTKTPITTNNFVNLARSGYFDGTDLFRTEAETGIIQGGSPHTQDNLDKGPGYSIPDEGMPFTTEDYKPGVIAMANAGPGTAGSQFFFVSQEKGSYLGDAAAIGPSAGLYAVFGQTTKGLDVLQKISDLESAPGSSTPSKQVTIEKVTITES